MSTKRALKRKRAKERRKKLQMDGKKVLESLKADLSKINENKSPPIADLSIEKIDLPQDFPDREHFIQIFSKFDITNPPPISEPNASDPNQNVIAPSSNDPSAHQTNILNSETQGEDIDESDEEPQRLSNKKRKLRDRLTVSQLKQIVERPDLVDLHDPNSPDPVLLIQLKSTRNTVQVPEHWQNKQRYLSSKRGVEKAPFKLPKAIEDTGIAELRNAGRLTSLKAKQRQRMDPKMGRLDVDYQKLHAAFFKNMEKPRMTSFGDVYYLGKEKEIKYRKHRPGSLSKRLCNALHMMDNGPPPYLINMQRFGPPPSYPELKIPGLNAPIPNGCKYGYSEGNWGKPPVNESGYPLYGDPFGVNSAFEQTESTAERFIWGQIEENVGEDEFEEEEESEDDDEAPVIVETIETPKEKIDNDSKPEEETNNNEQKESENK